MSQLPVVIRRATEADHAFVIGTWLRSYREDQLSADAYAKHIPDDVFYGEEGHRGVVRELLSRHGAFILAHSETPDDMYGFICADLPVLHYLYVKGPFRRLGFGKRLMHHAGFVHTSEAILETFANVICSHATRSFEFLRRDYGAIYNPYART